MKSNVLDLARPPRPVRPPAGTEHWRVQRTSDHLTGANPATRIVRGVETLVIPRHLTDEELDTLRIAVHKGAIVTNAEDVEAVLTDPMWQTVRLEYAQSAAPPEWRAAVGLE